MLNINVKITRYTKLLIVLVNNRKILTLLQHMWLYSIRYNNSMISKLCDELSTLLWILFQSITLYIEVMIIVHFLSFNNMKLLKGNSTIMKLVKDIVYVILVILTSSIDWV